MLSLRVLAGQTPKATLFISARSPKPPSSPPWTHSHLIPSPLSPHLAHELGTDDPVMNWALTTLSPQNTPRALPHHQQRHALIDQGPYWDIVCTRC